MKLRISFKNVQLDWNEGPIMIEGRETDKRAQTCTVRCEEASAEVESDAGLDLIGSDLWEKLSDALGRFGSDSPNDTDAAGSGDGNTDRSTDPA